MKTIIPDHIPDGFYTTKVNLEVTLVTQFGPEGALSYLQHQIGKGSYPIVRDMQIVSVKTNFPESKRGSPTDDFRDYVL